MNPDCSIRALLWGLRLESPANKLLSVLIVAAHPDDEVIGAGAQLPNWPNAEFALITDGSPRDLRDAQASAFKCREDYARARLEELEAALSLAGHGRKPPRALALVDQESSFNLVDLAQALHGLFLTIRPDVVITHPYEGGHPDHDATAFSVHAASRLLSAKYGWHPILLEMTSYHNRAGRIETGEFLPFDPMPVTTFVLSPAQRRFKRRLFECFRTQHRVLASFGIEHERFRRAPAYNFEKPPHDGRLYYEMFDWGMTGVRWRDLASQALVELGLAGSVRAELETEHVFNCS